MPLPAPSPTTLPSPPSIVQTVAPQTAPDLRWITPGAAWFDDRALQIQAHGGAILRIADTFYWFGEDRSPQNLPDRRYVACYSSNDLLHWTFRRQVVAATRPSDAGTGWWTLERPKVYFNSKTGKFVMYTHIDTRGYKLASIAVYTSDTVDGDYQFVKLFRPLDMESRDIGQFVDNDGSAYLIFECRPTNGFFIAQLSDDYLTVARQTCFIKEPMERGALVHHNGIYYLIGSWMTGWAPNANLYATATQLDGPWSTFRDIAPPLEKTFGSQSSFLVQVTGSQNTQVLFMADIWRPKMLWDSRYLWMPLQIADRRLVLPNPRPWSIDMQTGVVTYK